MLIKKRLQYIFLLVGTILIIGTFISSCGNVDQTTYKAQVRGVVVDSATGIPLPNSQVVCNTFSVMTYADTAGNFYFPELQMPRGEYIAYFTTSQYGYTSKTISAYIVSYHVNVLDTIRLKSSLK